MSKRDTVIDKAIRALDDKIRALTLAREELLTQRHAADLAAARPPVLKPLAKA